MPSSKLDGPLAARVHEWETAADGRAAERVKVLVHVTGDLAAVEAAGLSTELRIGDIVIGTVAVSDLDRVADLDDVVGVGSDRDTVPHLHDSAPEIHAPQARAVPPGFTGKGVIVGIVDTGIDVFHQAFRKPDGSTRIVSLLDLTLRDTIATTGGPTGGSIRLAWQPPTPPVAAGGSPVAAPAVETTPQLAFPLTAAAVRTALEAFNSLNPGDIVVTGGPLPGTPVVIDFAGRYDSRTFDSSKLSPVTLTGSTLTGGTAPAVTATRGRQFTAAEINAALPKPDQPFPSRDLVGHGTHVAGIAAGDGSQAGNCHGTDYYVGIAPEAELAIVHTSLSVSANLRGLHHIFEQPWRAAADPVKPAVVNFSLGGQLGPHDGTSFDEVAMDSILLVTTGRAIVVSAGNDGELYDQAHPEVHPQAGGGQHAAKVVPAHGSVTLGVVIQAGDRAEDLFDIWYIGAGRLSVNLTTPNPGGVSLAAPVAAGGFLSQPLAGHPVTIQSTLNNPPNNRHNISFQIKPPPGGQITPGTWTITLAETQGTATSMDCWTELETKDPHPRFVNADQSRAATVTIPGTAANVVTVGAYNTADGKIAEFSSRGPTSDGRVKPDLSAPGVAITAAMAGAGTTVCCDCCCDFYVAKDGTSMAAPHVTGVIALMLQADPTLDYVEIRAKLVAGCRPPDPGGAPLPNNDFGAGKVNAEASVLASKPPVATKVGAVPMADERAVLAATAYPDAYLPVHIRLRELQRRVQGSPAGELVAALLSAHVDEVRRLINLDRRVVVAWHRMHGPILLRMLLGDVQREVPLPSTLGGVPVATGLARLLDELARAGGPALVADIETHRAFLLALPGSALTELRQYLRVS